MALCVNESVKDDETPALVLKCVCPSLRRSEAWYALSACGHGVCVVPPFL